MILLTFICNAAESAADQIRANAQDLSNWEEVWTMRIGLARALIKATTKPQNISYSVCYRGRKYREEVTTKHSYWFLPSNISELAGKQPHGKYCSRPIKTYWDYERMFSHDVAMAVCRKESKELQEWARLALVSENKSAEYLERLEKFEETVKWPVCQGTSSSDGPFHGLLSGDSPFHRCCGGGKEKKHSPVDILSIDEEIEVEVTTTVPLLIPNLQDLLSVLDSDDPLSFSDTQMVLFNRLLDEVSDLGYDIPFSLEQMKFVNAVCSRLHREMEFARVQEFSRNNSPLVLLLGVTGSGKSTLVDLLTNESLRARKSSQNPKRVEIVGPHTGSGASSKTEWPELHKSSENTYADCPGVNDTRGKLQQVRNAISIKELFRCPKSVKFLIIDTASSIEDVGRGGNFIVMLRNLTKMVNTTSLPNNLSLVVTQHSADHMDLKHLRHYMRNLAENPAYYDIKDLLIYFSSPISRIVFFSRPLCNTPEGVYTDNTARCEVLRALEATEPLALNSLREVQNAFSDRSSLLVDRMKHGLMTALSTLFERNIMAPIETYIDEKINSTQELVKRRICTERDAQYVLKSYFESLLVELRRLKLSLLSADSALLADFHFLKIIRQRVSADANTDFSEIREVSASLDYIRNIVSTVPVSSVEKVWDARLLKLEQKLEKL